MSLLDVLDFCGLSFTGDSGSDSLSNSALPVDPLCGDLSLSGSIGADDHYPGELHGSLYHDVDLDLGAPLNIGGCEDM